MNSGSSRDKLDRIKNIIDDNTHEFPHDKFDRIKNIIKEYESLRDNLESVVLDYVDKHVTMLEFDLNKNLDKLTNEFNQLIDDPDIKTIVILVLYEKQKKANVEYQKIFNDGLANICKQNTKQMNIVLLVFPEVSCLVDKINTFPNIFVDIVKPAEKSYNGGTGSSMAAGAAIMDIIVSTIYKFNLIDEKIISREDFTWCKEIWFSEEISSKPANKKPRID